MKEEVYSYIVSSIYLLNQSIKKQDSKNVKLFSYLYNNYCDLSYQMQNTVSNQDIQFLSYCIVNLDHKIKKIINKNNAIDDKLVKIDNKINDIIDYINNSNKNEVIKKENKFVKYCKKIFNNICILLKKLYHKIYNIIFYKKIQRQLEEQRQKELELEEKKRNEQKKLIRNILNKNNGY